MGDKALVSVDGAPPRVVRAGERLGPAKVLEVARDRVRLEINGRRVDLSIGQANVYAGPGPGPQATDPAVGGSHVLTADGRGQFHAAGSINGHGVNFLVDTGASLVTLPQSVARRAGVDFRNAQPVHVSTANGVIPAQRVILNNISLGPIRANLVEAMVVDDRGLPVALLGMSFLNRADMHRQGDTLTLRQRY